MEKVDFLKELKALTEQDEVLKVSRSVSDLRQKFEDFLLEEERKAQVAQLEAGEAIDNKNEPDPLREEFFEIYRQFQIKRKDLQELKKAKEEENLRAKRALLTQLDQVVKEEENIGAAFAAYNEIHEAWKSTGDIPRDKRDEIQSEYSRLREIFFYNVKIYRELKEHDLHRNHQLKEEVVSKLAELLKLENLKDVEHSLKALQNEWEEIGPVTDSEWESLKERYWTNVRAVYQKINQYYDGRRKEMAQIIEAKSQMVEKAKEILSASQKNETSKDWDQSTQQLLSLQEDWKKLGLGIRQQSEAVWQQFRAVCDDFFNLKKAFYDTLKEASKDFVDAKRKLIDKANSLKDSTDWKETANALIRLQKDWKNIGHAGPRMEQKLWKEFRGACDVFFANRQQHFEEQDKANAENLVAKESLISEIQAYEPSEDKKQTLSDLKEFSKRFNELGHVPMKEKERIYNQFKKSIDQHYSKLKLDGEEKERVMFQVKLETLKASPDADRAMQKEKSDIRRQIDKLNQEMLQYENNLGFFGGKNADSLKREVEKKIDGHRNRIADLKNKLKMLQA